MNSHDALPVMTRPGFPSSAPPPPAGAMGWFDPPLLACDGRSVAAQVGQWSLILAGVGLDALLVTPLVALVLNEPGPAAFAISVVIAAVAAASMFVAGRLHAGARGTHRARLSPTAAVLGAAWVGVGTTLAALRVAGANTSTDTSSFGTAAAGGMDTGSLIAAVAFFFLYVISGVLAFNDGTHRNDAHAAWLLTRARLASAQANLVQWEGALRRLHDEHARRVADTHHVKILAANEGQRSADLLKEAQAFVRVEIARVKGDPTITGLASPAHPDHPDHVGTTTTDFSNTDTGS